MNVQDIIRKKRNGNVMTDAEIDFLVKGISSGAIPDYQVSAWAMAVYFSGMDKREIRSLAVAMAHSGEMMDLSEIKGIKVDKHSTGGVGDKTTMIVIPLVAAAGIPAAKMSGRGLGHTGGTIDKFESIPGFQPEMTHSQFVNQVNRVNAAVISQSGNLVPADKRLYAIRDVTATVDSIPLIASSIMSKKIAAGAQGIMLDVKVGSGAFMKTLDEAADLAQTMVEIGRGAGRDVIALISDMDQPLGYTVGNALEVREAIDTLKGQGPPDLEQLSITLAAHMLCLAGKYRHVDEAVSELNSLLKTGLAYKKFCELVKAQGGKLGENRNYGLPLATIQLGVRSENEGFVNKLDAFEIGRTAMLLGAGREKIGDNIDPAVGVELVKKKGDYVNRGDILAILHVNNEALLPAGSSNLAKCYQLTLARPESVPLIYSVIE